MCVCVKSLCKQKQTSSPKNKSLKKSDQFIFPFLLLQPFLDSLHGFDMSNATTVQITHSIKVGGLLTCRGLAPVHWFPTVKEGWYMPMGHHHERNRRLGIWWQIPPPKKKMTETRRRLGRIAQKRRAGTKSRSMRYYRFRFCEYLGAAIICSKCCKLQPFVFEVSVSYFF